jgi:hypothetical protein
MPLLSFRVLLLKDSKVVLMHILNSPQYKTLTIFECLVPFVDELDIRKSFKGFKLPRSDNQVKHKCPTNGFDVDHCSALESLDSFHCRRGRIEI